MAFASDRAEVLERAAGERAMLRLDEFPDQLYQYFADKKELYLHLVELAVAAMMQSLRDQQLDPDADTFTLLRHQMSATVEASRRLPPESRLLQRAFTAEAPFPDELAAMARHTGEHHMLHLVERGRARGELRRDVDPQLQAFLLRTLATGIGPFLVERLGRTAVREGPEVERVFTQVVAVLRDGLGAPRAMTTTR